MNEFKENIRNAKLSDVITWIITIVMMLLYPLYTIYTSDFTNILPDGSTQIIEKPWWLYIIGIVTWNLFLFIILICMTLLAGVFAKIGHWVVKD